MIKDYFRPTSLIEASKLLKENPHAIPIGGGTSVINVDEEIAVVDLQDLDLKYIKKDGERFTIGSGTTLDHIGKYFSGNESLVRALKIEGSKNQRNVASIAGLIKLGNGRSALLTSLLTLDTTIRFYNEKIEMQFEEFLKVRKTHKKLITQLSIDDPAGLHFDSVSRSPLDLPIVCCALYRKGNKTRGAVGGFGVAPSAVPAEFFIGQNHNHISKYIDFSDDEWASAEYRSTVSQIILKRLNEISIKGNQ